jgi:hypothetical protein
MTKRLSVVSAGVVIYNTAAKILNSTDISREPKLGFLVSHAAQLSVGQARKCYNLRLDQGDTG